MKTATPLPAASANPRNILYPYVAFWLALTAVYEIIYMMSPGMTMGEAAWAGIGVMGPAALLGLLVIRGVNRMRLPSTIDWRFIATHVALAFVFAFSWIILVASLRNLELRIITGAWQGQTPSPSAVRWHMVSGVMIYAAIATATHASVVTRRARAARKDAELNALRAQLSPHFLFNTMHSIISLVSRDPAAAESALEKISDLMRYPLKSHADVNSWSTVGEELEFVRTYVDLETLRLGERLRVEYQIDDGVLGFMVPPMLIQPLLENSIQHAVSRNAGGATVSISIQRENGVQVLKVSDDGVKTGEGTQKNRHGIGLEAVQARLQLCFGDKYDFDSGSRDSGGYMTVIRMPIDADRQVQ